MTQLFFIALAYFIGAYFGYQLGYPYGKSNQIDADEYIIRKSGAALLYDIGYSDYWRYDEPRLSDYDDYLEGWNEAELEDDYLWGDQ